MNRLFLESHLFSFFLYLRGLGYEVCRFIPRFVYCITLPEQFFSNESGNWSGVCREDCLQLALSSPLKWSVILIGSYKTFDVKHNLKEGFCLCCQGIKVLLSPIEIFKHSKNRSPMYAKCHF